MIRFTILAAAAVASGAAGANWDSCETCSDPTTEPTYPIGQTSWWVLVDNRPESPTYLSVVSGNANEPNGNGRIRWPRADGQAYDIPGHTWAVVTTTNAATLDRRVYEQDQISTLDLGTNRQTVTFVGRRKPLDEVRTAVEQLSLQMIAQCEADPRKATACENAIGAMARKSLGQAISDEEVETINSCGAWDLNCQGPNEANRDRILAELICAYDEESAECNLPCATDGDPATVCVMPALNNGWIVPEVDIPAVGDSDALIDSISALAQESAQ